MTARELLLSFEGRINRRRFWLAAISVLIAAFVVAVAVAPMPKRVGQVVALVAALGALYPLAAISAKRFHDRGKSGWWATIGFVPVVGAIWVIVENGFLAGTPGPNRYGPDPLRPRRHVARRG
ncbi:DUF805 domain-containing protein [Consotaella salsifontis]|uniref:Uncharacterized membrane protein YhaH, DUF805 family n=1 Tax=Consotaella salsifontis TaxID=1365950 RepID=A0A1T4PT69_9HYPH|nr:DUF805 domain-containing protein [Consotaella salsifontis]SJZ94629.1 Uncharacterized membrane protein YhaH, DUF805 family [Consotaella salsifontis]